MTETRVDIIIADKISENVPRKLIDISKAAKSAAKNIDILNGFLRSLDSSKLTKVYNELNKLNSLKKQSISIEKSNADSILKTSQAQSKLNIEKAKLKNVAESGRLARRKQTIDLINRQKMAITRLAAAEQREKIAKDRAAISAIKRRRAELQLEAALKRSARAHEKARNQAAKYGGALAKAGGSVLTYLHNLNKLKNRILGATAAFSALRFTLNASDSYTNIENKVKSVTKTKEGFQYAVEQIDRVATNVRAPIDAVAQTYARFDQATRAMGKGQQEAVGIMESVSMAFTLGGASTVEMTQGLYQLGQAFNKGKLDGDEFRTMMETAPVAMQAIADEMGVLKGDLIALAPTGAITAEIMADAFENASEDIKKAFAKLTPTLEQSLSVLDNKFKIAMKGFSEPFAKAVLKIALNFESLFSIVKTLGFAIGLTFAVNKLSAFSGSIGGLKGGFKGLLKSVKSFGAATRLMAATNPFLLVAAGIATAVFLINEFGDEISVTEDGFVSLKDVALAVWSFIKEGAEITMIGLRQAYNIVMDNLVERWNILKGKANGAWLSIKLEAMSALSKIWDFFKWVFNGLIRVGLTTGQFLSAQWNNFDAAAKKALKSVLNYFIDIFNKVMSFYADYMNKLIETSNKIGKATGLGELFDFKVQAFQMDKFKDAGLDAVNELGQSWKEMWEANDKDYMQGFADSMIETTGNAIEKVKEGFGFVKDRIMERAREIAEARRTEAIPEKGTGVGRTIKKHSGSAKDQTDHFAEAIAALEKELSLLQRISPEMKRINKFVEIQEDLLKKGVDITEKQANALKNRINAIAVQEYNNLLGETNKELNSQILLLDNKAQADMHSAEFQEIVNKFKAEGLELDKEAANIIKTKIDFLKREGLIQEEVGRIYDETVGLNDELVIQVQAMSRAMENGYLTAEKYARTINSIAIEYARLRTEMGTGNVEDFSISSLGAMLSDYQGMAVGLSDSLGNMMDDFSNGFANSVGTAIVDAENFGDLIKEVAKDAVGSLIAAFVKLGIQWAVNATVAKSLAATTAASSTATSIAAAKATAAAWATPAALVSLGSYGANSAAATTGLLSTTALSKAISASSAIGFMNGGYTGNIGAHNVAGVVHGNEYVFDAEATSRIGVGNLEALRQQSRNQGAATAQASQSVGTNIKIENYGTSKAFDVEQLSPNEIRIIARDEAERAVNRDVPNIVSREISNPNSRVSKSLSQNTKASRRY